MCDHNQFDADVVINRLEDTGEFMAEIKISCLECGIKMQFLGLEPGVNTQGSTVNIDGTEARLSIAPFGSRPNPIHQLTYGIRKFDS